MREHVSRRQKKTTTGFSIPSLKHPTRGFGLESSAISRQAVPEIQRLHKPLTLDISRIPLRSPQAKLSISQPGDISEQEADSVAQQVMQRMAQPVNRQPIHREEAPESEELQMKPLANSITPLVQREALPEDEEELQMKSLDNNILQREALPEDEEELQMKPMVQRQGEAGMAAAPDLEASINQARGGGQAIADNIRQPMEVAFGADFSKVKVHTDGQSDQLNRSIQARAFTTGQDVFFRSGEYNPESRGGQELLAHELTHVVQQNRKMVERSPQSVEQLQQHSATQTPSASVGDRIKTGTEDFSGDLMDDVKLDYNSQKPSHLQADWPRQSDFSDNMFQIESDLYTLNAHQEGEPQSPEARQKALVGFFHPGSVAFEFKQDMENRVKKYLLSMKQAFPGVFDEELTVKDTEKVLNKALNVEMKSWVSE